MSGNTLAKQYQELLYSLFTANIMGLEGDSKLNSETGMMDTYVAKSELLDAFINVLNEFGKTMAEDERLKNETNS